MPVFLVFVVFWFFGGHYYNPGGTNYGFYIPLLIAALDLGLILAPIAIPIFLVYNCYLVIYHIHDYTVFFWNYREQRNFERMMIESIKQQIDEHNKQVLAQNIE